MKIKTIFPFYNLLELEPTQKPHFIAAIILMALPLYMPTSLKGGRGVNIIRFLCFGISLFALTWMIIDPSIIDLSPEKVFDARKLSKEEYENFKK